MNHLILPYKESYFTGKEGTHIFSYKFDVFPHVFESQFNSPKFFNSTLFEPLIELLWRGSRLYEPEISQLLVNHLPKFKFKTNTSFDPSIRKFDINNTSLTLSCGSLAEIFYPLSICRNEENMTILNESCPLIKNDLFFEASNNLLNLDTMFNHSKSISNNYFIPMPPPNLTGKLHIGHALLLSIQDCLIRFKRMQGYNTLWLPGFDHAGIGASIAFHKGLKDKIQYNENYKTKYDNFTKWQQKHRSDITQQMYKLGISCDWSRSLFTFDKLYTDSVKMAFLQLYSRNLIYQDTYPISWVPSIFSSVSDIELTTNKENTPLFFIRYFLDYNTDPSLSVFSNKSIPFSEPNKHNGKQFEYISIGTTCPETIFSDVAICVHPNDNRYIKFINKRVIVPLYNKSIPIIQDLNVNPSLGTGAIKIAPPHSSMDYNIARSHGIEISNISYDKNRRMVRDPYKYLDKIDARYKIWQDLVSKGYGITIDKSHMSFVSRYKITNEIVEPFLSNQWFLKTKDMALKAKEALINQTIQIFPLHMTKVCINWLDNIKDWCISRQFISGHQIPVWHFITNNSEPLKKASNLYTNSSFLIESGQKKRFSIAASSLEEAEKIFLASYENSNSSYTCYQDPDVLDTWFSSSLWPIVAVDGFYALKSYDSQSSEQNNLYNLYFPANLLETGYDILNCWVLRMVMLSLELKNKVPFNKVLLHGLIRDKFGQKMSKSKENTLDPIQLISKYGADALRLNLLNHMHPGRDISIKSIDPLKSSKFINKVWSVSRFIDKFLTNQETTIKSNYSIIRSVLHSNNSISLIELNLLEKAMISLTHHMVIEITRNLEAYDFIKATKELEKFVKHELASWFLQYFRQLNISSRKKKPENFSNIKTYSLLVYVWLNCLKLLHPFIPFVTEASYQLLKSRINLPPWIMTSPWPLKMNTSLTNKSFIDQEAIHQFKIAKKIISGIRRYQNEALKKNQFKVKIISPNSQLIKIFKRSEDIFKMYLTPELVFIFFEYKNKEEIKSKYKLLIDEENLILHIWGMKNSLDTKYVI